MRLVALLLLGMLAVPTASAAPPAAAPPAPEARYEWCYQDHCGVVPAECWRASDLVPFIVIECDKILASPLETVQEALALDP
jgi:hypothetical protein